MRHRVRFVALAGQHGSFSDDPYQCTPSLLSNLPSSLLEVSITWFPDSLSIKFLLCTFQFSCLLSHRTASGTRQESTVRNV